MKNDTIKIVGYSVGDMSVGISSCEFQIDTGLTSLSEEDKEYIIKGMIRDMWELHDNGDLKFNFTDEISDDDWDYVRRFTDDDSIKILKEERYNIKKMLTEKLIE